MIDPDHKTIYKIYVTTTNIPNSGTKSNVFLQIYGKNKSRNSKSSDILTVKFPLEKSKTNKVRFQPGQTDLFEIEEAYLGQIKKIKVTHDGKNLINSGWHLKKIVIEIPEFDKKYKFYCNNWFNSLESGGKTERDLVPLAKDEDFDSSDDEGKNKKDNKEKNRSDSDDDIPKVKKRNSDKSSEKNSKKIRYDVRIKTSECSKIDPGINFDLIIIGSNNEETSTIKLNSQPSDNEKEKFLKNNLDLFRLEAKDVGNVKI